MGNFESDHATAISVASRNLYSSISRSKIQRQPSTGSIASIIRFVQRQNSMSKLSSPKIEKTTSSQQMLQEDEEQRQDNQGIISNDDKGTGAAVDMAAESSNDSEKKNNTEAEEEEKEKERVVRNCGIVQRTSDAFSPMKKTRMIMQQHDTKVCEYDDIDDCNSTVASSSVAGSDASSTTFFSFSPRKLVLENPNEFLNEEDLSSILSAYFVKMTTDGNDMIARTGVASRDLFSGSSVPQISILDYTKRMMRYLTGIAKSEYESRKDLYIVNDMAVRYMVMAIIYLERIKSKSKFIISSRNIHRLIITAITIASKIADDIQPKNSYFAKLGGIPMSELNLLENEFCSLIGFHLHIKPEEFKSRYESIIQSNRLNHTWSLSQTDIDRSTYSSSPVASIAAPAA